MEEKKLINEENLIINQIENTPFKHIEKDGEKYVICGKVILETEKTKEETTEWLKEKPWEAIALLTQAIYNEINNNNKN